VIVTYEVWLAEVQASLRAINMPLDEWQQSWHFDFTAEHAAGTSPEDAAANANRFWWREQNRALNQDCRNTPNCWLPRGHPGECQLA